MRPEGGALTGLEAVEALEALEESRRRIQVASDERRKVIEKDLHAGAQQHLVALAVKLGLAEVLVRDDPGAAEQLLRELRQDVQASIGSLRELAHRIYPSLLRDRGLGEALEAAARRSATPCTVRSVLSQRYPADVETAVYFACVDAVEGLGARPDVSRMTIEVRPGPFAGSVAFVIEAVLAPPARPDVERPGWLIAMDDRLCAAGGQVTLDRGPGPFAVRGQIPAVEADAA